MLTYDIKARLRYKTVQYYEYTEVIQLSYDTIDAVVDFQPDFFLVRSSVQQQYRCATSEAVLPVVAPSR